MKEFNSLITTVIPTYKRPELLKRAIKSVLNQTYSNFQLCIYDNCSGDKTREVVESFARNDPRVKYFCHDTNIGSLKNFEYGLSKVISPYFSFLSDDDFLFPEFYETAISKLKEFPEAAFFGGNCVFIDKNNKIIEVTFKEEKDKIMLMNESVGNFVGNPFIPWTSIVFNSEKVKQYKLESSFKMSDVDYIYRIMYNHPIFVSSKLCAVFCALPSSASFNYQLDDMLPYVDKIIPKLNSYSNIDRDIHEEACFRIKRLVIDYISIKAFEAVKNKDFEDLSDLKIILKEKLQANDLLKRLNFYEKFRNYSFLWYPSLFVRRYIIKSFRFLFGKKKHLKEREEVLNLLHNLG